MRKIVAGNRAYFILRAILKSHLARKENNALPIQNAHLIQNDYAGLSETWTLRK